MEDTYNEKQLLFQLTKGYEWAFEKIYHRYSIRLYYKLLKLLKSDFYAHELLQDVFLTVWNNRQKIDVEKSFRSYVFCIATNKAYDYFRKNLKDKKLHEQLLKRSQLQYCDIESNMIKKENSIILYKAIELLPCKRREVFKLSKFEGKTYSEISHQLGISTSTISDHIVKANLFIRNQLVNIVCMK